MKKQQLQHNANNCYSKTRFNNNNNRQFSSRAKYGFGKQICVNTVRYGFNTVKATVNTGKFIGKKTIMTARAVSRVAERQAIRFATEKFKQSAVDDMTRGAVVTSSLVKDMYSGLKNRRQGKKKFKAEKQKFKNQKSKLKFTQKSNNQILKQHKAEHLKQKKNFKLQKKKYKQLKSTGSDSGLRKQLYKRRKKILKEKNKDFRKIKYAEKQIKIASKKQLQWQKRAKKAAKPLSIVSQPVNYGVKRLYSNVAFRALTADPNNDFTQALKSGKNLYSEFKRNQKAKKAKSNKKDQKKLQNKLAKNKSKFLVSNNKLQSQKHYIDKTKKNWKMRQRRRQYQYKANSIKGIKERLKKNSKDAAKGLLDIVKKSLVVFIPILLVVMILLILLLSIFAILTDSGFILGTYTTYDNELADAEEYYTKELYDFNEKFISIQDDWKSGFEKFNIKTSDLPEPTSIHLSTTDMDYDPYVLLSFLCAYAYDYSKKQEDQDMWEFNGDLEDVCDDLITAEYELHYTFFTSTNSKGDKIVSLYYWMQQKGSMVEAAKSLLRNKDNADERIAYFELLLYGDNGKQFYGNHQSIPLPLANLGMNDITSYYHYYGYDVHTWGKRHCSMTDSHKGVDIFANPYTHVISPVDGEIVDYDQNSYIVIEAKNVKIWENERRDIKITLKNVFSSTIENKIKKGDKVKKGQMIGYLTGKSQCSDDEIHTSFDSAYLHVEIEMFYGFFERYNNIDPLIFFNREKGKIDE